MYECTHYLKWEKNEANKRGKNAPVRIGVRETETSTKCRTEWKQWKNTLHIYIFNRKTTEIFISSATFSLTKSHWTVWKQRDSISSHDFFFTFSPIYIHGRFSTTSSSSSHRITMPSIVVFFITFALLSIIPFIPHIFSSVFALLQEFNLWYTAFFCNGIHATDFAS